jgi:uncharacterized protein (TIGR03790 family)
MILLALVASLGHAATLSAQRLGVLYQVGDPSSREVAAYYAVKRGVPSENVVGIELPGTASISPERFDQIRSDALSRLPMSVESLLLVWNLPYEVGCMSITTAFAAGYRPGFCEPGCQPTTANPLYDTAEWLPADTVGWFPAMLLPSQDLSLAHALIDRGVAAEASRPSGTLYLIRTSDTARNVRASSYEEVKLSLNRRLKIVELAVPPERDIEDAIGYFIGAKQVEDLQRVKFLPGAVADHLTSTGGALQGNHQMSVLMWLAQGATGSYGNVSEPCNRLEKFPNIAVLYAHYLRGEPLLEAYWKSVRMPGQGLFVGEPLARPF